MENYTYNCKYCNKEFIPTRRRVQKYCSNSCRTNAHILKNKTNNGKNKAVNVNIKATDSQLSKTKIEVMSLQGVGNATAGTLLADSLKNLVTKHENKPATKGDIKNLIDTLGLRYHLVQNSPPRHDGALPHYDLETQKIIYLLQ